jgi:hypothetical protein
MDDKMKTPEQKAIECGATHFQLTPNGQHVSLYYKKENGKWFYLTCKYTWKICDLPTFVERYSYLLEI